MSRKITDLIAVLALSFCISAAAAQQSADNQLSDEQCLAAFSAAQQTLFACVKNARDQAKQDVAAQLGELMDACTEENLRKYPDNAGACGLVLPILAAAYSEWDSTSHNLEYGNEMKKCLASFEEKRPPRSSCPKIGTGSPLYCATRAAADGACQSVCGDGNNCGCSKSFGIPNLCISRTQARLVHLPGGCDSAKEATKPCFDACGSDADCQKQCSAMEAQAVAACLGWDPPKPIKTNTSSGSGGSKPSATSASTPVRSNPNVAPNNLDRFGLGPSYITTDPSLPNQRGAGKTAQGSSSKQKTTTTLAKPTMDAKPAANPLFIDQSQGMKPTQQIK